MLETESKNIAKKSIPELLLNIGNLPSIPSVLVDVSKLLENPMTSANELASAIGKDQGIVAKILSVANSTFYGLPRRVSTIDFAIVVLGFENIKNIIIALTTIETFKSKNDKFWNKRDYWIHSMVVAAAAKQIADEIGFTHSGEAFTAGLLHDLGISILQRYLANEFNEICSLVASEGIGYLEAEKLVLNTTHQEIGNMLVDKWRLPKSLSMSVLNHHKPGECPGNRELVSIVHLADYMTQVFHTATLSWDENYAFDESVIDILKFKDKERLNRFIESYKQNYRNYLETSY